MQVFICKGGRGDDLHSSIFNLSKLIRSDFFPSRTRSKTSFHSNCVRKGMERGSD